jgi:C1A family cysteine protease
MTIKRLGWKPDLPDFRDRRLRIVAPPVMPPKVDLRTDCKTGCPAVYDQGDLGSCTANAIAAALEFDQRRQNLKEFVPSRLFIYYNERVIEHTIKEDAGAELRDGMKSVSKQGAPSEQTWPYDIAQFAHRPSEVAYKEGKKHPAVTYERLNASDGRACLASGFPFVFGFTVYTNFMSEEVAKTGNVDMPGPAEQVEGGHAVMAIGYDDSTKRFLIRNSWGTGWGQQGHFTMPYDYVLNSNLADDFWTIRVVK